MKITVNEQLTGTAGSPKIMAINILLYTFVFSVLFGLIILITSSKPLLDRLLDLFFIAIAFPLAFTITIGVLMILPIYLWKKHKLKIITCELSHNNFHLMINNKTKLNSDLSSIINVEHIQENINGFNSAEYFKIIYKNDRGKKKNIRIPLNYINEYDKIILMNLMTDLKIQISDE